MNGVGLSKHNTRTSRNVGTSRTHEQCTHGLYVQRRGWDESRLGRNTRAGRGTCTIYYNATWQLQKNERRETNTKTESPTWHMSAHTGSPWLSPRLHSTQRRQMARTYS